MQSIINSDDYWDKRFNEDWELNDGPRQSCFFAQLALDNVPSWLIKQIQVESLTVADWGCAQGDGTNVWANYINSQQLSGVDFSQIAIDQAHERYPAIQFICENWLESKNLTTKSYDIVFSSNTLEHFHNPFDVLKILSGKANKAVVLALPYREINRIDEHFSTFLAENIPTELANNFRLVWSKVIDCTCIPSTQWNGHQIILIYANVSWTNSLQLKLTDCILEKIDVDTEFKFLNEEIIKKDTKISSLNQTLSDKDAQISSLMQDVVNKDTQIENIEQLYNELKDEYQRIMRSNLMKVQQNMKKKLNHVKKLGFLIKLFFKILSTQGPKVALIKAKNKFQRIALISKNPMTDFQMSSQESYLLSRNAQDDYIFNYLDNGIEENHFNILDVNISALCKKYGYEKIVILPLSYPLELTQRPDHILRCFIDAGYVCILLKIDNDKSYFKELSKNKYVTNIFAGTISYFSNKNIVLYLTYPFFGYLVKYFPNARYLYDVLDHLSVFSLHCNAMQEDHEALLKIANVTIFSSLKLMNQNIIEQNNPFLIKNGVWSEDFINSSSNFILHDEYVVGYHGVLSELLDWQLLKYIVDIPNVRLIMIGPISQFEEWTDDVIKIKEQVFNSKQFTYIEPVPYTELKNYLSKFDAGIIPFVINDKTNPVLPLKLFEYMASGLPIYVTETETLKEYDKHIHVGSVDQIIHDIKKNTLLKKPIDRVNYDEILSSADWGKQMAPIISLLEKQNQIERMVGIRKVDIVNINFFDWDGITLYKGGAERYIYDLACLLKKYGWEPRIIQNANKKFEIDFHGITIVGVQTDSGGDLRLMSRKYREVCKNAELIIASPADLACELRGLNVIGINHGIYWDHKFKKLNNANLTEYKNIFDALKVATSVVAVDTNFINWVRTYDYSLGGKINYIPNYYDSEIFVGREKSFDEKIRILYPRRLYDARGIFITLKAFDYLFAKYSDIELHLVGQANNDDSEIITKFISKYKDRVIWEEFDMHEMYKVYSTSHIVIVPTLYSEGTSLSCIEAMATNNAIVATNIGGLPNLIIDEFNGLLINPTATALSTAIEKILNDRQLMSEMANNGMRMAGTFEKTNWERKWIKEILGVHQ